MTLAVVRAVVLAVTVLVALLVRHTPALVPVDVATLPRG